MSEPLNDAARTLEIAQGELAVLATNFEAFFAKMRRRHKWDLIIWTTAAWWIALALGYAIGKYL